VNAPLPSTANKAACCSSAKQATCCEPTEKSSCCGSSADELASGSCGCQTLNDQNVIEQGTHVNIMNNSKLPVVVIGAGPVGLAAAAHLVSHGETPLVLEGGASVGASVSSWGHVRIFSPWEYNVDSAARKLLEGHGWVHPPLSGYPTGRELVERYLEPLSTLPEIQPHLRLNTWVTAVTRLGLSRTNTANRETTPFVVRVRSNGKEKDVLAKAVIDASGTYTSPNPLGGSGLPALGEQENADHIFYGIPNILSTERSRYAGRRVMVVGSGHSAFDVLLDLLELVEAEPVTSITWVIRKNTIGNLFGGGDDDQLPERGRLGTRIQEMVERGALNMVTGFKTSRVTKTPAGIILSDGQRDLAAVDEVVAVTGFRPNLELTRELRLSLDEVVESPTQLAPLIDPNIHSCGSVPPHGAMELKHPEADFYMVGMKSYGRAPTFLMLTGYEQVRSVVLAITGDWEAARKVELVLPETGVCNGGFGEAEGAACCGPVSVSQAVPAFVADPSLQISTAPLLASLAGNCCGD
jgi:thioredoxin reductase